MLLPFIVFNWDFIPLILIKLSQVPSEAQKIDLTNEVRAKSESMWRSRLVELMEDLEASKISIHGLLQVWHSVSLKKIETNKTLDSDLSRVWGVKFYFCSAPKSPRNKYYNRPLLNNTSASFLTPFTSIEPPPWNIDVMKNLNMKN